MDVTIEKKLRDLWKVQQIDHKLDGIKALMGELPMEVADLDDEIEGLQTRIAHITEDIKDLEESISKNKNQIKDFNRQIDKSKDQLNAVKNSREFDALNKEIEILGLEIMAAEKRIREIGNQLEAKKELLNSTNSTLNDRNKDLDYKKQELINIEKENEEELTKLGSDREKAFEALDERLKKAYARIRNNTRNGIAVAPILRGSCGGCFSKIPPQRQSDIRAHFRIIDCEHCGRILVDAAITGMEAEAPAPEKEKTTRRKLRIGAKAE